MRNRFMIAGFLYALISTAEASDINWHMLKENAQSLNTRIWNGVRSSEKKIESYLDFIPEEENLLDSSGKVTAELPSVVELLEDPIVSQDKKVTDSLTSFSQSVGSIFQQCSNSKKIALTMLFTETIERFKKDLSVFRGVQKKLKSDDPSQEFDKAKSPAKRGITEQKFEYHHPSPALSGRLP